MININPKALIILGKIPIHRAKKDAYKFVQALMGGQRAKGCNRPLEMFFHVNFAPAPENYHHKIMLLGAASRLTNFDLGTFSFPIGKERPQVPHYEGNKF